jgi:hypothetical protein
MSDNRNGLGSCPFNLIVSMRLAVAQLLIFSW